MSQKDNAGLKPRQYTLHAACIQKQKLRFSRSVPAHLRIEVLNREEPTCQMCGLAPGEVDSATNKTAALQVDFIEGKESLGTDELSGLRILCSVCREGRRRMAAGRPQDRLAVVSDLECQSRRSGSRL
jgi:hypothetical protein